MGNSSPGFARQSVRRALIALATTAALACASASRAQSTEAEPAPNEVPRRQPAKGVLPQLSFLLRLPEGLQLSDPEDPRPPDEPVEYGRKFPIGGQEVINRGYALPLPVGLSIIYVPNVQDQTITDLNPAFGKGVVPPR